MNIVYILLMIVCFALVGPLVIEVAGYLWHRYVEHEGKAGKTVQIKHVQHHQKDYPTSNLRPNAKKYRSAHSWSWYVLTVILIVLALIIIPRPYSYAAILGGLIYAKFVVSYCHKAFHLPHHWLQKYAWFRQLTRLHDIHHYEVANYGIVFFFMDKLFGTYKTKLTKPKSNTFVVASDL
jgi:sterol desaturase/sphingolipid hydroxylase (fatty acid hydroxylase superfamily)